MRKFFGLLICISLLIVLSGCFTSTFNRLGNEYSLVYESHDKTVRLEIAMRTTNVGRLYINDNENLYEFVARYTVIQEYIEVYIKSPELTDSIFMMSVSFESINFFKTNYDVMYLKNDMNVGINNPEFELFTDFDVTLNRVYDEEVSALNYFYNNWQNNDGTIVFTNDDLIYYYGNSIQGIFYDEDVWISFSNDSFTLWSKVDLNMKLSGEVTIEELNIILEPFEWCIDYPATITLTFMEISNT